MVLLILAGVFFVATIALVFLCDKITKAPVNPETMWKQWDRAGLCLDGIMCTVSLAAVCAIVGIVTMAGGVR